MPQSARHNHAYGRDGLTGTQDVHALLDSFARYYESDVFVVVADLDDFHNVNATLGVDKGDAMLRAVGQAIVGQFGDAHTFHYGSDEFAIVTSFESERELLDELEHLNANIRTLGLPGSRNSLGLRCSFGYAHGRMERASDLHDAIRLADRQMFEAKRLGKGCAVGAPMKEHRSKAKDASTTYKVYESDRLTGLANITYFHGHFLAQANTIARPTVVFFNVQNFKGYNENFGYGAGDELLVGIARAIAHAFPDCLTARYNADQFVVCASNDDVIDGIRSVRHAFRSNIKDSSIWLKAGVYEVEDLSLDSSLCCDRAKLACDTIKGRRDVYFRVYDEELKLQIAMRHYVLDHFEEAMENGYIKVYYQPIVHVATGEVCDEEALTRWDDPERGLIYPEQFIPVLEEARLIHRLDLYMVRRSCENMRRRLRRGTVKDVPAVSVNLSRLDFELCDIVTEIEKILVYYDVPRSYVSIEVTESALTGNQEFLKAEIDRFRADGSEVWMDDFGSGYSSLNLLQEYSFDLIKLDMGFLRSFEKNNTARILLANVINLVKELGIKTLVEGVETEEHLQFLKSLGCGKAQGYYFARPQSLQMVMRSIATGTYPPIEPVKERDFFSKLARINLMRPVPTADINGHYVTSDVPAAILMRQGGKWTYLNATDVYREFWRKIDGRTLEDNVSRYNTENSEERARLEGALSAALVSRSWEGMVFFIDGRPCSIRIKVIANDPQFDSTALLAIVS